MKYKKSDELLQVAFDVDDKIDIPKDYVLDELHEESMLFLKNSKTQSITCLSKIRDTREVEYSLNVNNNQSYIDIYTGLGISDNWIKQIKTEFNSLNTYLNNRKSGNKIKLNIDDITARFRLYKENIKAIQIPIQEDIEQFSKNITNRLCITLLKILIGIYQTIQGSIDDYNICLWIYYVLVMLQLPLIDDDNSILFKLNKLIYTKGPETINAKLLFVILSEIFNQKILL
jgi:hypothetical protein